MKKSQKFWLIVGAIVLIAADLIIVPHIDINSPDIVRFFGVCIVLGNLWYIGYVLLVFIPKFNNWLDGTR